MKTGIQRGFLSSSAIALIAGLVRGVCEVRGRGLRFAVASVAALAPVAVSAHTDLLGYIVTAGSSAGLYNVEIIYGSWHTGSIAPEGDLNLYQDGTLVGTQTFTSLLGPVANGVLPAGLVPGDNYFWADGDDLTSDGTGHTIYNFQSVTFLDITPGTFTFGYATTGGLSQNWTPSGNAIQNGSFVLTSGGGVVVPGTIPNIDMAQPSYASSGLETLVNPVFEGGTLAIDEDGVNYTTNFTLDDSPTNTVDSLGNDTTLSGVFSDTTGFAGTITFADTVGGGSVTLTGANTHTGGTTLDSGILILGGAGTLGAATGATTVNGGTLNLGGTSQTQASLTQNGGVIANGNIDVNDYVLTNGTLATDAVVDASNQFALTNGLIDGTLTGTGTLNKIGTGTVTLSGPNTYTGGTAITGGTLIGSAGSFGSGAIANDATLVLQQQTDATLLNPLSGTGVLNKLGGGTLAITGDNSAYTGTTNIVGGALDISGSLANSAVNVGSGALLTGTGTVGTTTLASGSAIMPAGTTLGGINVNGAFTQSAGAVYYTQISPATVTSDTIVVAGPAVLEAGAILNVSQTSFAINPIGTRYTVLTSNALTGTYTLTGNTHLTAFLTLVDTYDAQNAYLEVTQTTNFVDVAGTFNQRQTATGVQTLPPTSPVFTAVSLSPTIDDARYAYDQLSGEIYASLLGSLANDSRFARNAALSRMQDINCKVEQPDEKNQAVGSDDRNEQGCSSEYLTAWGSAFGSWGARDGDGNAHDLDRSTGGFFVGMDAPLDSTWRFGVFTGYSHSETNVDYVRSSAQTDDYHFGVYGSGQWSNLALRMGAVYTHHEISTNRHVAFGSFDERVSADYSARTAQTFAELAYQATFNSARFEPFAQIAYANVDTGGFNETGGSAALHSDGSTFDSTFTTLGVRFSGDYFVNGMKLRPNAMIGWRHAFESTAKTGLAFTGSSGFEVAGTPIASDTLVLEAGFDVDVTPNASLGLSYAGQYGDGEVDQGVRADFKLRF
ncbi:MAG: autotransporter domain-containing protein [Mesorhizobium sp.]